MLYKVPCPTRQDGFTTIWYSTYPARPNTDGGRNHAKSLLGIKSATDLDQVDYLADLSPTNLEYTRFLNLSRSFTPKKK